MIRAVGNPVELVLALALGQLTRSRRSFLLLFAGILACLGTGLVARYADMSAAGFGLCVLAVLAVEPEGPRGTTVDFLEGPRDLDRVLHETGEVSLEMAVRDAEVLFKASPYFVGPDGIEDMKHRNFRGHAGDLLEAVSPEERFVFYEREFYPSFGGIVAHVHLEYILDQLRQVAFRHDGLRLLGVSFQ